MPVITRKIELYIPDGEHKDRHWQMLRQLSYDGYKAANLVVNHQFAGEALVNRIASINAKRHLERESIAQELTVLTESLLTTSDTKTLAKLRKEQDLQRKKLQEADKSIRKEAQQEAQKFYEGSKQNSTYQVLGAEFPQMPSYLRGAINKRVVQEYSNDLTNVFRGERSLRTYKRGMPIHFMKESLRIRREETGEFVFHWRLSKT
jgi:putative transposase